EMDCPRMTREGTSDTARREAGTRHSRRQPPRPRWPRASRTWLREADGEVSTTEDEGVPQPPCLDRISDIDGRNREVAAMSSIGFGCSDREATGLRLDQCDHPTRSPRWPEGPR